MASGSRQTPPSAGNAIPRLDPAVAIGVDVEVYFSRAGFVNHDRDSRGAGAAVAKLASTRLAAISHFHDDVLGLRRR